MSATGAPVRVLLVDDQALFREALATLRAGALGYLLTDVTGKRLVEALLAAARGGPVLQPSVAARVVARFAALPDDAPPRSQPLVVPLSDRELEVVRLLAEGGSNREIAAALFLAEGTVKNHITNVLAKLGTRDRTHGRARRPRGAAAAGPHRPRRRRGAGHGHQHGAGHGRLDAVPRPLVARHRRDVRGDVPALRRPAGAVLGRCPR